jgi:sirohydrochlorin ferrochelatase
MSRTEQGVAEDLGGSEATVKVAAKTGVIIVDHGSRREESNAMLETFVAAFAEAGPWPVVEAAHMELAEPSIETAFERCVARGVEQVVVMPYFLLPGRHWHEDIPQLAHAAALSHPGIPYLVGAPLGLHPLMAGVVRARLDHCLAHAAGEGPACELCAGTGRCSLRLATSEGALKD